MTELASKLAKAITEGHHAAQQHAADTAPERHKATISAVFEALESEVSDLWKELGVVDFDDPTISPELRAMWAPMIGPTHQADAIFNVLALVGIALSGAFSAAAGLNQQLNERALYMHADIKPDAATTAAMQARGFIDDATANRWYPDVGTKGAVAQATLDLAWNHIPNETLLRLVQLGKITEDRARAIMRYSALTPQEIEDYLGLLVVPMDAATAVRAAVQNHINTGELAALLVKNGIDPIYTEVMFETAGRPPGIQQLTQLLNRGEVTEDVLRQAVRESDIKSKYVDAIVAMRYHPPPMRSIVAMLRKKSIDETVARKWLGFVGLLPEAIDAVVREAQTATGSAGHHLSMQQHVAAYEAQLEDRGTVHAALEAVGWTAADIDLELALADHRQTIARQSRAANAIGTRYVGWKIDRAAASSALDALQLPTAARDEALSAWDIEREERRPGLSMADLKAAFKKKVLDVTAVRARLLEMGHSQADTDLLVATYF